jgi:hypothetical protein
MPAIKLKRKTDAAGAPASLVDGEIAVNQSEGAIYGKRGSDIVHYTQPVGGATYLDRTPEDETVVVIFEMPADVTVTDIITKTSTGTLSLQAQYDDGSANNIGSSISVTSTKLKTTLGSPANVDAGDVLQIVISSTSSAEDLAVQFVWKLR